MDIGGTEKGGNENMRVFIGIDRRQPVAAQVLAHSIWKRASKPVSITMLDIRQLPITRTGLTEFTFSRYLVPWLCDYQGGALFLDADMLCLDDIHKLPSSMPRFKCGDGVTDHAAVYVVQNAERFEWPSLMYFNNEKCAALTPEFIENGNPHHLDWGAVGNIHKDWNHIVPYSGKNPNAKIVHFTQGIPCFEETKDCEYGEEWRQEAREAATTVPWEAIMGTSVHKQRMFG